MVYEYLIGFKGYKTVSKEEAGENNLLQTVYRNGELLNTQSFAEVRAKAAEGVMQYKNT